MPARPRLSAALVAASLPAAGLCAYCGQANVRIVGEAALVVALALMILGGVLAGQQTGRRENLADTAPRGARRIPNKSADCRSAPAPRAPLGALGRPLYVPPGTDDVPAFVRAALARDCTRSLCCPDDGCPVGPDGCARERG